LSSRRLDAKEPSKSNEELIPESIQVILPRGAGFVLDKNARMSSGHPGIVWRMDGQDYRLHLRLYPLAGN
jgi:hypothetical protein